MNEDLIARIVQFTHKLRDMPALAASCTAAANIYRNPETWYGKVIVEHRMVKNTTLRVRFLKWLFRFCDNPAVHIDLWFALQPLMAQTSNA